MTRPRRRSTDHATTGTGPAPGSDVTINLDAEHQEAIEAAMDLDRDYFQRHESASSYVRPALEHEWCPAAGYCGPAGGLRVRVYYVAPGVRARVPL